MTKTEKLELLAFDSIKYTCLKNKTTCLNQVVLNELLEHNHLAIHFMLRKSGFNVEQLKQVVKRKPINIGSTPQQLKASISLAISFDVFLSDLKKGKQEVLTKLRDCLTLPTVKKNDTR